MKKFLIALLVLSCQISFSQAKKKAVSTPKKVVFTTPKIKRAPEKPLPPEKTVNKIVSILRKNDFPMAFKFEINQEKTILPKEEFAEVIELYPSSYSEEIDVTIISKSAVDTLKYKSNDGSKPERIAYSYYDSRKWCNGIVNKETIKAIENKTKIITSFKAVLDKPKKKILYLTNVSNGRKYVPTAYEPPSLSVGF